MDEGLYDLLKSGDDSDSVVSTNFYIQFSLTKASSLKIYPVLRSPFLFACILRIYLQDSKDPKMSKEAERQLSRKQAEHPGDIIANWDHQKQ